MVWSRAARTPEDREAQEDTIFGDLHATLEFYARGGEKGVRKT
jgi:hypothetical protein